MNTISAMASQTVAMARTRRQAYARARAPKRVQRLGRRCDQPPRTREPATRCGNMRARSQIRQAFHSAHVQCQMLQIVCSHMACAQRCARLELHATSPCTETVQIRRQRIRDAAGKKAQWREKIEALKKEEVVLQPQVDRLASERPHSLHPEQCPATTFKRPGRHSCSQALVSPGG